MGRWIEGMMGLLAGRSWAKLALCGVVGMAVSGGCVYRYDTFTQGDGNGACQAFGDGLSEVEAGGGFACGKTWCQDGENCLGGECYEWECGDGVCSEGESCDLCPGDCGVDCVSRGFAGLQAGSFWMGSPAGLGEACPGAYAGGGCTGDGTGTTLAEVGPQDRGDEQLHYVTLGHRFEMKETEVTQGEWAEAMLAWTGEEWNPSNFVACGSECPVERVSWFDALAYLNWMSERAGLNPCYELTNIYCKVGTTFVGNDASKCMTGGMRGIGKADVGLTQAAHPLCEGYRLPSEAEWEYAARGGHVTAYGDGQGLDAAHEACETPFHLTAVCWYCGNNTTESPKPVAGLSANSWGLFDMHGNVWEWCWDGWDGLPYKTGPVVDPQGQDEWSKRAVRGGSFREKAKDVRSANRARAEQADYLVEIGFRPCRTLQ